MSIIVGTDGYDLLIGAEAGDSISGLGGGDVLEGRGGNDTLDGGAGYDQLVGGIGNDLVFGGDDPDWFGTNALEAIGDDTLNGGADGDTFQDRYGHNVLDGGTGDDIFYVRIVDGGSDVATGGTGQDTYVALADFFDADVDYMVQDFAVGAGGDRLELGDLLNQSAAYLHFTSGNPFNPAVGVLRFVDSGTGDTWVQYDLDGAAGSARGWITVVTLENVAASAITADNLLGEIPLDGSAVAGRTITGTSGPDSLNGWLGDDSLTGGEGDDQFNINDSSLLYNSPTYLFGIGNDTLLGGAGNDVFRDTLGNNLFDGGPGADYFWVLSYDGGINSLSGGEDGDVYKLLGISGAGYHVTDFAEGNAGDLVDVRDLVEISAGLGAYSSGNPFHADIGILRLLPFGADMLVQWDRDGTEGSGYGFVSLLTLDGKAAAAFTADNFGGIAPDGSTSPGVTITGSAAADTLAGAFSDDTLAGLGGDDDLNGGGGNDSIDGGSGRDFMSGGLGDDTLAGGEGDDVFSRGGLEYVGDDVLQGGPGNDNFFDSSGTNLLDGGDGNDLFYVWDNGAVDAANTMTGGAGRDIYQVNYVEDSTHEVSDFAAGANGDFLDLDEALGYSAEFPNGYAGGDPFALGFLRLFQSGSATLLQLDLDGAAHADHTWETLLTLQDVTASSITSDNFLGELVVGTEGDDVLSGNIGNDTILGLGGNDTLGGNNGNDVLDGGQGDNIVQGDAGTDVALLPGTLADYSVSILSPAAPGQQSYDPGFGLEPGDIVNIANQSGRIDRLVGVEKVRFLGDPSTSADDLEFLVTPEGLLASAALRRGDTYRADINNLGSLTGGALNDVLDGLGGADTLTGGPGNDVLIGGAGNDRLAGGEGNDSYVVDAAGDQVVENAAEGAADRVQSLLATYSLASLPGIEVLEYIGAAAFQGTGNGSANILIGRTGADVLAGGAGDDTLISSGGNDTLNGGTGNDSLDGGTGSDLVVLAGNRDAYTVTSLFQGVHLNTIATAETDLLVNIERLRFGDGTEATLASILASTPTEFADSLVGGEGADSINALEGNDTVRGNGGSDTLDGGTGNDLLIGGAGNDTYLVDSASDQVLELPLAGVDLVRTGLASFALADNVEQLLYTGPGNFAGTGNASPNLLTGGSGDDTLDGGAGADTLEGGAGNDTYVVDTQSDVLIDTAGTADTVVALATYSFASNAAIENGLAAAGTAPVNLTGNALHNVLTGNVGNNVLDGGLGNDTLSGGRGDDTYIVDSAGDVLVELPGQGRDTIVTPFSTVLASPYENLTLSGASSVNATGNAAGNLLRGNTGNNVLDGAGGLDTMDGGAGNDTYVIDRLLEQGLISDSGGIDTVVSSANYTGLQAGLENLTLAARAWIGLGNDAANMITGTARANILIGGGGNDTLNGGNGADILDGGLGADRFVFDTTPSASNVDFIVDFSAAQGDRMVLDNDIFIALLTPGLLDATAFRAAAGATSGADASDRIVLNTASGALYYDADGVGGVSALQIAVLNGVAGMGAANFEIVD